MRSPENLSLKSSLVLPAVEMRLAANSSACYRAHSHDEFSFGLIDQGAALYQNREHLNRIGRGSLVTINPADLHACNPDKGRWSYRMLFVDTEWMGGLQRELSPCSADYQPFAEVLATRPEIGRDFDRLYKLLDGAGTALETETELIGFLAPFFSGQDRDTTPASEPPKSLHRVCELLADNLSANLSLDDLCQEAALNRYQLIRLFRKHYGQPPHAYQIDQRIKKARALLRDRNARLDDVALQLGFADQSHFHRHFKQRLAMTPGTYQSFWN
ncbi:helix-turn-helix transcriptional regulator [Marinobacterium lutimaris]|uniref:Transcriptional regulator, AraC family n=1 Tax=Marinobacterium lutimaris TaxID=568106 RepID=A0A1H5Y2P8_9GAMM|nr:AraC family transcriptional regulator [Marinobacterium lutimaris]SEG17967.1 transcriptional regulator, AraC family [Marinobacterium lutimaris]